MDYKDISIDEAKALVWSMDVENEISAVETVLKKVSSSLTSAAGSDDTIIQGISRVGSTLETVWAGMCNEFKKVQKTLNDVIKKFGKTAAAVLDDLETVKGRAGGR